MMGILIHEVESTTGRSVLRAYRTQRRGGIRITISDNSGRIMYDSDDCYDWSNAIHQAELWARDYEEVL